VIKLRRNWNRRCWGGKNESYDLPIKKPSDSVVYLRNLIDEGLQSTLQTEITKNVKWKRLINQKKNGDWCS
jgi:hypothetical protein